MKVFKFLSTRLRIYCFAVVAIAGVGACMTSVWPILLSNVYDDIASGVINNTRDGTVPILMFGGAFAVAELCIIFRRVWVDKIAASFEKDLRNRSIIKLLRLPTRFYNSNTSGEYTAKINQAVAGSSQLVKVICNNIVPSVFISVFTVIQVMRKAPDVIAIILFSYIVFEILISALQIKSQNGVRETLIEKKAKLDGTICQSIQNIEMIRVTNAENYEFCRVSPLTENIRSVESRHHMCMGTFDAIKQMIKVVYTVLLLLISVMLVSVGRINGGMVITIVLLFQQLVVPIDSVHVFMDELASSSVKAKELISLLLEAEDDIFSPKLTDTSFPEGDIHVKNLTVYTPDGKTTICERRCFTLKAGKITALRGPTGCGKSSIIKAIMRFYPAYGDVTIKSQSLRELSQKTICRGIHDMVQQPIFFSGTLRDNLVYGLDYVPSDEQLLFALKNALIFNELQEKNGSVLLLPIAENGSNFSGGQRQRIALARAFLRQPKWFFVDEATANIDDETTKRVFENLAHYAKSIGAGIFCISHQKEIIDGCDEIIDLVTQEVA